MTVLCDPQTSGGLLIAVEENEIEEVKSLLKDNYLEPLPFGNLIERSDILIKVV